MLSIISTACTTSWPTVTSCSPAMRLSQWLMGMSTRWALLWYALPRESRTARRQSPELRWSEAEYMLAMAVHLLEVIAWQRTKDGQHNRNRPKPLRTPAERAEAERRRDNALSAREDIDKILGMHEGGA